MSETETSHPDERSTSPAEVSWALHQLVVAAAAMDTALGRRLGLGPSEYQAMKHLMTAERRLGPVELGTLVGLTSGAATSLVDRLERAGHLARRRDRDDRRRVILEATADAVDDARRHLRPLEDHLGEVLESYSADDRQAIARFLDDAVVAYTAFSTAPTG